MKPKYPIYIISKGRAASGLTWKELRFLGIEHTIVVEDTEYDEYARHINNGSLLRLPFSNLGLGSTPARNYVFEHSVSRGNPKHWILDDNISHFYRLNRNRKLRVGDGTIFRCAEDFVDRYANVPVAGFNYEHLCIAIDRHRPFRINTRIYSCILIDNKMPLRWRGMYNEDTDLSLRVLKSGMCTILFNAFLCNKTCTMRMSGGNTDNVYRGTHNRYEFAESLRKMHPDVVKVTRKFGRWHHHVDYRPFKGNKLIKKDNAIQYTGVNNYGMRLERQSPGLDSKGT